MKPTWRTVSLGEALTQYKKYVHALEAREYPKLSVKLYGRGCVLDGSASGSEVRMQRHQLAKSGQVILSEIWGKKGAIGFVPPEGDGALVTSHFFLFDLTEILLTRSWLHWLIKANYFEAELSGQARGTTGYAAVRPKQFLELKIPLPPLDEQRRIVARIEALAGRIAEAQGLQDYAVQEADQVVFTALSATLDDEKWRVQRLEQVLSEAPRNGLAPQREIDVGGTRMLRINAVSSSPSRYVDLSAYKTVDVPDAIARPFALKDNDVFVVRYNGDINRVAKACVFKGPNNEGIVYPDKLIRLRVDQAKMVPDFLVYALSSRKVRSQIEVLGKTTTGQIGISGASVKSFEVPVPPLHDQQQIVAMMDSLQTRVDALRRLQESTQAELAALLPAVLDKALRGEL